MASPVPSRRLAAAHTKYRDTTQAIRQRTHGIIRASWMDMPDYRDGNVEKFATSTAHVVTAAQRATATLTAAFTEQAARELTGKARKTALDLGRLAALREGADPVEVYLRPGHQVWSELARGVAFTAAVDHGLTRALTLSATDLQLAKADASFQTFQQDDRVLAYQREPGENPCDLCAFAAGEVSKSDEVMPIHENCACDAVPVYDAATASQAKSVDEIATAADKPDARTRFADTMLTGSVSDLPPEVQAQREKNLAITEKWSQRFR